MTKTKLLFSIGLGLFVLIISFLISLSSNLWMDALFKSTIAFVFTTALSLGTMILIGAITQMNGADSTESDDANVSNTEEPKREKEDQKQGEKLHQDEGKGSHIDLHTPDDVEFKPLDFTRSGKHSE